MNDEMPRRFDDPDILAESLKALAHPARLRILEILAARRSCVCGEIVEVMPLAQATVSQHLKVLKDAGLVRGTIDGRNSCYCLDPAALTTLRAALARFLGGLETGAPTATSPISEETAA
jgi:ArsR family transcriptional regulator